jgi:hypothetical protein
MMNEAKKKQIENCNKFLDSHIWLSVWDLDCKEIAYSRKPTKAEIAIGYGATYYRSFPLRDVVGNNGQIKKRLFAKDEGVWYSRS